MVEPSSPIGISRFWSDWSSWSAIRRGRKKAKQPVRDVLPKRVRHDWKRLKSRVDALADEPDAALRSARLHEVRKAAKRARYAAEPLVGVYGKDAKRFVKAMKRIQSLLGEQHDTVAAADPVAEHGRPCGRGGRRHLHPRRAARPRGT